MTASAQLAADAAAVIRSVLAEHELAAAEQPAGTFVVTLPGERKLSTTCVLRVGEHSVEIHAFVARRPDENAEGVYRFLLERNLRNYGVAFGIDHLGDIYLHGHLGLHAVTADEVDRLLGCVLEYADSTFNTICELGFAGSIRREWEWRTSRGESTRNLEAFRHLLEHEDDG